jgi:hypothetical protein
MERPADQLRLDGNAAAGMLGEMFPFDVTVTTAICDGCGLSSPLGELVLYGPPMGVILRCPGCAHLMLCATRLRGVLRLDLRGIRSWRLPVS